MYVLTNNFLTIKRYCLAQEFSGELCEIFKHSLSRSVVHSDGFHALHTESDSQRMFLFTMKEDTKRSSVPPKKLFTELSRWSTSNSVGYLLQTQYLLSYYI